METVEKLPLAFNEYEAYGISQNYSAFLLNIKNISAEKADEIESDYQSQRYKIFHSELTTNTDGTYDLKLIIAQASFTF